MIHSIRSLGAAYARPVLGLLTLSLAAVPAWSQTPEDPAVEEEVTVTAQRVEQDLQDVPISVIAVRRRGDRSSVRPSAMCRSWRTRDPRPHRHRPEHRRNGEIDPDHPRHRRQHLRPRHRDDGRLVRRRYLHAAPADLRQPGCSTSTASRYSAWSAGHAVGPQLHRWRDQRRHPRSVEAQFHGRLFAGLRRVRQGRPVAFRADQFAGSPSASALGEACSGRRVRAAC